MDIWHYHPVTKEYIGHGKADPDPLNKDGWLVPAHATTVAPEQSPGANETLVFKDGYWLLMPDHRGETWYNRDGDVIKVSQLGDPIGFGYTQAPPPETEEQAAERERAVIDAELAEIDRKSVRALRAWAAGASTQADRDFLLSLEAQAATLREQRKGR